MDGFPLNFVDRPRGTETDRDQPSGKGSSTGPNLYPDVLRLRNGQHCVEWDVELYTTPYHTIIPDVRCFTHSAYELRSHDSRAL